MNRLYVGGDILVAVLLVLVFGADFYYGVGPAPGSTDSAWELTDFPTATTIHEESAADGAGSTSTETPPFSFTIDDIEECGQTYRDVTATLHNNQDETATGVTVFTRAFAGEDNTADADMVWEGKEKIGTVAAGESHTSTERVELLLQEANKIQQHDGWIIILTTVQTDKRTVTFSDSEQMT